MRGCYPAAMMRSPLRAWLVLAVLTLGCRPDDSTAPAVSPPASSHASSPAQSSAGTPPVEDSEPSSPTAAPDGSPCLRAEDCQSGVCEGHGCGEDSPGQCMARSRMCTRDMQVYCGCDGETFRSSGSCPGRRYAHRGACEGSDEATLP